MLDSTKRKALVVGIDQYASLGDLFGCVADAHAVRNVLARNGDAEGTVNFDVRLLLAARPGGAVSRKEIKQAAEELFADEVEIALFYFAGHGHLEATGGYLCGSDCRTLDDGFPLGDLLILANQSKAHNRVILLDSCHSGMAGARPQSPSSAELEEGITILTASTADQYATEFNGKGVFTTLLVNALNGAAADLVGNVTPGSVYAHIDQSLGAWDQRPVFKTNVKGFVSLRRVQPFISLADLHRLTEFFPAAGCEFQLDPAFEPESDAPDAQKTAMFAVLQKYNRVTLLVPVGAPHMWHAAMQSKTCRLTVLGEHYRRLVELGRL